MSDYDDLVERLAAIEEETCATGPTTSSARRGRRR